MAEEDRPVEVAVVPKFDMPHHKSKMSSKDVKSSAKKYNILLDLHPCAPSEGWTMDQLPKDTIGKGAEGKIFQETFSEMKGWKEKFFFLDQRAIPDAMAWRHHDSDVNDMLPEDGFRMEDDFPGFHPVFKDIEGMRLPCPSIYAFLSFSVSQLGKGLLSQPQIRRLRKQSRKKKAQAAKRVNDEGEDSKAKTNRRKTPAVRENKTTGSGHVSSPTPLWTIVSTGRVVIVQSGSDGENERTHDAPKDDHNSNRLSPRESANELVHNYVDIDGGNTKESPLRLEPFVNLSGKPLNADKEEVFLSSQSLAHHTAHYTLSFGGPLS
ncbi:hypothetical protein Tco_1356112 [Tanacetum coccineum]